MIFQFKEPSILRLVGFTFALLSWSQLGWTDNRPNPAPPANGSKSQTENHVMNPNQSTETTKNALPTHTTVAQPTDLTSSPPPSSDPKSRSSSINFEDEIVEGMNKNPFDSLTNIYKKDNRDQKRLYRKKENFNYELKLTIREMGL